MANTYNLKKDKQMEKTHFQTSEELLAQAEEARQAGNREKCLKLKAEAEQHKQLQVKENHNKVVESVQKEFPVGKLIRGIGHVDKIEHECGTKTGWVNIIVSGKKYKPSNLHKAIHNAEQAEKVHKDIFMNAKKDAKEIKLYGDDIYAIVRLLHIEDKIPNYDDIEEYNLDYLSEVRSYAHKEAIDDGHSDDKAEEIADKAEAEEMDNLYRQWENGVTSAIEYLFNNHKLNFVIKEEKKLHKDKNGKEWPYTIKHYFISPENSWEDAANAIKETINGVGMFYFTDLQEFIGSSAQETICMHLHWLKDYPRVYGTSNVHTIYESAWRR